MEGLIYVTVLHFVYLSATQDPDMCSPGICCSDYILHKNICTDRLVVPIISYAMTGVQVRGFVECEAGTYGRNCSETCDDGYYGRRCKEQCSTYCKGICNKVNGSCPDSHNIEDFLKVRLWIIAGVSSVFVILTCGFIGVFFFCKICKCVIKKRRTVGQNPNQDTQPSYGVRYESDRDMQDFSANITRPPPTNDNGSANGSANKHVPEIPNVENSKPKTKKRYNLVRKVTVSQEVTSCSNMSEDDDDVFDSDDCDDYTNTCGGVQISGLPSKQSSFNTFLSPYDNSQSGNDDNTEYGKLWR